MNVGKLCWNHWIGAFVFAFIFVLGISPALPYLTTAAHALSPQMKVEKIVVFKEKRELHLLDSEGKQLKTYLVALGTNPIGHKQKQGDGRTPEGKYTIDYRNPKSRFHRSLHITYPNAQDKLNAQKMGVDPGGDIMIHGLPNGRWDSSATPIDSPIGPLDVSLSQTKRLKKSGTL